MRVGFTGTQTGMTNWQANQLLEVIKFRNCSEFVFGDCIGSDIEAAMIARDNGVKIFTVYPQNKDTRKRAWFCNPHQFIDMMHPTLAHIENGQWRETASGLRVRWMAAKPPLERNKLIVDNCEYMIATPKEFEHTLRSGTWATIRYAWKSKKDITIIPPKED